MKQFDDLHEVLQKLHLLEEIAFTITYSDPKDGYLLPINNDDNFAKAIECARPLLRIFLQRKGESVLWDLSGQSTLKRGKFLPQLIGSPRVKLPAISYPENFRQVAQIIDVDSVPERCRRVRLLKHGSERPLGFYIRDGTSLRVTPTGLEKVPGIFISRLVPGGLAESTGLLAVNDEVLEVNGIEVAGKTLDQVTDMMVANSSNLIVTVKPATQRYPLVEQAPERGASARTSQLSHASNLSTQSARSSDDERDDVCLLANRSNGVLHL
ncbi:Partitioning defective 6 gamma [Amphibalanus amphitrite]|uniref:Partitioning defective 6 gamma n=2 Tax=Amphibalanus amphitrite TaxID=1232801 RepID=A0A6A4WWS9_AMPAM|nr:Partitioning defective 6 gamma [Amphibalanus amphitrite]